MDAQIEQGGPLASQDVVDEIDAMFGQFMPGNLENMESLYTGTAEILEALATNFHSLEADLKDKESFPVRPDTAAYFNSFASWLTEGAEQLTDEGIDGFKGDYADAYENAEGGVENQALDHAANQD